MVLKPDQERVKTLLQDTITLLCRNGLNYKSEFNVNALIGITLDKDEVFLVDIRETVKNKGDEESGEDASNDVTASIVEPESPKSPGSGRKKNKKKRNRSQSGLSDAESVTSDSVSGTPNIKQMKPDAEDDDSDDAIIIKDEPGYDQNSYGQQNDILGELSQQGQLYAAPSSLSGTSSWDSPSQQTSQVSQRSIATASLPSSSAPQQMRSVRPSFLHHHQSVSGHSVNFDQLQKTDHSVRQSLTCPQCNATCANHSVLRQHLDRHSGKHPYACPYCEFGTSNSKRMLSHLMKAHTGVFAYLCIYCNLQFTSLTLLKTHLQNQHSDQLQNTSVQMLETDISWSSPNEAGTRTSRNATDNADSDITDTTNLVGESSRIKSLTFLKMHLQNKQSNVSQLQTSSIQIPETDLSWSSSNETGASTSRNATDDIVDTTDLVIESSRIKSRYVKDESFQ